jgi:hypothetical protein
MVRWHDDWRGEWRLDWRGKEPTNNVGPYGPSGVATFLLGLEQGYKVKHRWPFSLEKFQSGKERRGSRNDAPQESYDGAALLFGDHPRNIRATLARFAALGSVFQLGLPHEALTIAEAPAGTLVFVHATALANVDWAKPGQRVAVVNRDADNELQAVEATIQSVGADSLELDVDPGLVGAVGGQVMPLRPIYLEPTQGFARYRTVAEAWSLNARAAIFDFAPDLAQLALGPITTSPGFDDVFVTARSFSLNPLSFGLQAYAGDPAGLYTGFPIPTFNFVPGVTTIGDLATALASSPVVRLTGSWNPADVIEAGDACAAALTGATAAGSQGRGAVLTEYAGDGTSRPVWDRRLVVATTAADSLQAMTHIIDHGALPYAIGTADEPDWGRAVKFTQDTPYDWQWLKLFFATTRGPQESFWLPTWRADMDFVASGVGTVTVAVEDLTAWWPDQREHAMFLEADGTQTYAKVTDAADNGDGTWTLTLDDPDSVPDTDPVLISWLELCRFERDEFVFVFGPAGVSLDTIARVVQP